MLKALTIQNPTHGHITGAPVVTYHTLLTVQDAVHEHWGFSPDLTANVDDDPGGYHNNTSPIIYNIDHEYLRCKHQHGVLTGTYKSRIFDTEIAADRYLVYIVGQDTAEPDMVVVGAGTTWDSQVPVPATWASIGVATNTWTNIFALDRGPSVTMRLYYGETSPPTSYVDKMEILSAIVTARYFQVQITINDPGGEVYAYVEEFYLRFCQAEAV